MTQQTFQWRVLPTEHQINDWDKEATYRAIAVLGNALGEEAFRRRIAAMREVDESQITPVKNWDFNTLRRTLVDLKRDIGANHMLDLLKDEIQQGQLAAKQWLHVEFPAAFTNEMVSRHQEHFAIEFHNAVMRME